MINPGGYNRHLESLSRGDFDISRLYCLTPININTGTSESLTSYISRLAEAHCVSVGTLIGKEMAPVLGKEYIIKSSKNGGNTFYKSGNELNGIGKLADDFAQCLSEFTGLNSVKSLTLVALHDVLPIRDMFRQNKAWCPLCLESWHKKSNPIYEPLIWCIKAVKLCEIHGTMLSSICSNCRMEIPVISRRARNGFCSFCGCWLGLNTINKDEKMSFEQLVWEQYITANIGHLISQKSELKSASRSDIYNFIKLVAEKLGGLCAFSRYFDIPKSSASQWLEGVHRPTLQTLLKICYRLKVSIIEAFSPEQICFSISPGNSGYSDTMVDIKTKNKAKVKRINWNVVENKLNDIISNRTSPPPSVNEAAKGLECTKRSLYCHFSALCKKISANHTQYLKLVKEERINEAALNIAEAVNTIKNSGLYPSRRRIESLLSPNIVLRESAYQIAWKKAMLDINVPDRIIVKA